MSCLNQEYICDIKFICQSITINLSNATGQFDIQYIYFEINPPHHKSRWVLWQITPSLAKLISHYMHLKFNDSIQTHVLTSQTPVRMYTEREPGGRPTNDISIEFEILWKFVILLFITYLADHNKILYTSRHYSNTVVTCAKLRCDRLGTFWIRAHRIVIEFRIRSKHR